MGYWLMINERITCFVGVHWVVNEKFMCIFASLLFIIFFVVKKLILIVTIGIFTIVLSSCVVNRKNAGPFRADKMPPEFFATLDSVIYEAWQLYYSEQANWIASDLALAKYQVEDLGGTLSWQPNDTTWSVIFMDKKKENSLLEYQIITSEGKGIVMDSVRPLTPTELGEFDKRVKIIDGAVERYGDSLLFAPQSFGQPNIDIIRINDTITRLYFMQGTVLEDVIPFGNDYSIDFDKELNPIAFRKYHHSLIATRTKTEKGGKVETVMHSHTKDNPFITATDICNFLLYRPKDLDIFYVYSTAYKCKFAYSIHMNSIITVLD